MNVKNNKRRQETVNKITAAFMELLENRELSQIKVTTICEMAGINRGTFYANFADVYDLADKLHTRLKREVNDLFAADVRVRCTHADFVKLMEHIFQHIQKNQRLYSFYFRLGYDDVEDLKLYDIPLIEHNLQREHISYHISFFKGGFNTIVKKWLRGGCKESPGEMRDIILREYQGRFRQ